MKLWLDDIRDPNLHGAIGFTWVKTYDEAIKYLSTGSVTFASLDHDLTIDDTLGNPKGEKTGYDVICWMEENNIIPNNGIACHSQNPSGKARIEQVIRKLYSRKSL